MALTATACQKVVEDILSQLKMKAGNLEKFKLPCFRSNLYYDVRYRDVIDDPYQVQLGALKKVWERESGSREVRRRRVVGELLRKKRKCLRCAECRACSSGVFA